MRIEEVRQERKFALYLDERELTLIYKLLCITPAGGPDQALYDEIKTVLYGG